MQSWSLYQPLLCIHCMYYCFEDIVARTKSRLIKCCNFGTLIFEQLKSLRTLKFKFLFHNASNTSISIILSYLHKFLAVVYTTNSKVAYITFTMVMPIHILVSYNCYSTYFNNLNTWQLVQYMCNYNSGYRCIMWFTILVKVIYNAINSV